VVVKLNALPTLTVANAAQVIVDGTVWTVPHHRMESHHAVLRTSRPEANTDAAPSTVFEFK
jgi:hypothetical protein